MKDIDLRVEAPITQMLLNKASHDLTPMSGTFELTPLCNLTCKMCYVRKTNNEVKKHPRRMMKLDDWLKIAEEARRAGLLYLLITGGEPFLWPDFWELYVKLSKMGFLISINTNGTLIDETVVQRLKEYPPTRINITLYGVGDDTYERLCGVKGIFHRVDKAITSLVNAGITVKLNGSLTPHNIQDLEACVSYAEEKKLIYEAATYMFPPLRRNESMVGENDRFTPAEAAYYRAKTYRLQNGQNHYHEYMKSIVDGSSYPLGLDADCVDLKNGKINCRAGKAAFWITWDGQMTPCGMMPRPAVDLYEKTFMDSWNTLTEQSKQLVLSGICRNCSNHLMCHACAAMAMAETGVTSEVPTYLCEITEETRRLALLEMEGKSFPDKPLEGINH